MGGNALKHIETRRIPRAEYEQLVPRVLGLVAEHLGRDRRACVVQSYREKADFGDMDVIVEFDGMREDHVEVLAQAFGSRAYVNNFPPETSPRNADVTSFDVDGFQVDLIRSNAETFESMRDYYAWNDLGNLMGRVADRMGFKFGWQGLMLPLRDGTNQFADVVVTRDAKLALSFMGYDAEHWAKGFDRPEDIYRYAASSRYFDASAFYLENRNAKARIREVKRKTYIGFLAWLEAHESEIKSFAFSEDKSMWLERMKAFFPDAERQRLQAIAELEKGRQVKRLFNGERVNELTGISGSDLGNFMGEVRQSFATPHEFSSWVLSHRDRPEVFDQEIQSRARQFDPQKGTPRRHTMRQ